MSTGAVSIDIRAGRHCITHTFFASKIISHNVNPDTNPYFETLMSTEEVWVMRELTVNSV